MRNGKTGVSLPNRMFKFATTYIFCLASSSGSSSSNSNNIINNIVNMHLPSRGEATDVPSILKPVLVLDVDNTLYSEHDTPGIERQIVSNTHAFGRKYFNFTSKECDDLYHLYGSTAEGLRHKLLHNHTELQTIQVVLRNFYREVYQDIDLSCLFSPNSPNTTGYDHGKTSREHLMQLSHSMPLYFASNSPKRHVLKVLTALGLQSVKYQDILTPDSLDEELLFPTKHSPQEFYKPILKRHSPLSHRIVLVDDSEYNLKQAALVGIKGLHINNDNLSLEKAIGVFLGHVNINYTFSDVKYLQSKNIVDARSINEAVWNLLGDELSSHFSLKDNEEVLRIVDLGAGVLFMLDMILNGGGSCRSLLLKKMDSSRWKEIHYCAFEPNKCLLNACRERLRHLGFRETTTDKNKEKLVFKFRREASDSFPLKILVEFHVRDFRRVEKAWNDTPHLIVGCCFADLWSDPNELAVALLRYTNVETALIYFPITFAGTTQFVPPSPFGEGKIPSDTLAFQLYADNLIQSHKHNVDPISMIDAFQDHGAQLLAKGRSDWKIDPTQHEYLWETMLYFFGTSGATEMRKRRWDAGGWVQRARERRPTIRVSNVDLLFRLNSWSEERRQRIIQSDKNTAQEIQFVAPYKVSTITKVYKSHLDPGQVEVQSICSLISSGTELKIFKGMFDEAALDVNIAGMKEETMRYPLSYGYSLVGRVKRCAPDVEDAEQILGRIVFTFSTHSSLVVVNRKDIHLVPEGILAEDAMFFPSMETALSLVHDAHARIGERIAVFGQGLIGLLVTAVLSLNRIGTVTVFDNLTDRLAAASAMGASQALFPEQASEAGPFDVSLEVSGNAHALQSAIDNTQGRIIVGSWYGNTDVTLKLGIDFHRSHKTIQTSQVSEIPAELSALWSKERRFALAWELLKAIRPSRRLLTKTVSLGEAQEAYELLNTGKEIAISFKYN